jgi:hypothetical protein
VLAWSGVLSLDELEVAASVLQTVLSIGPSREHYAESVDNICEILHANTAAANLDWGLNAAELLAIYPSPNPEARLRFFMAVVDLVQSARHRLSAAQAALLALLARDFGCDDLLPSLPTASSPAPVAAQAFRGRIGIYTLMEGAGQRARGLLQSILPNAHVELNSDSVATDRLKNLAATADLFVFAWRSSKHQAFYCAKDARAGKEMLMPLGKGSASIVRVVLETLVNAQPA